jgi:hypothetical protein
MSNLPGREPLEEDCRQLWKLGVKLGARAGEKLLLTSSTRSGAHVDAPTITRTSPVDHWRAKDDFADCVIMDGVTVLSWSEEARKWSDGKGGPLEQFWH